jgi:hypothetical protein
LLHHRELPDFNRTTIELGLRLFERPIILVGITPSLLFSRYSPLNLSLVTSLGATTGFKGLGMGISGFWKEAIALNCCLVIGDNKIKQIDNNMGIITKNNPSTFIIPITSGSGVTDGDRREL